MPYERQAYGSPSDKLLVAEFQQVYRKPAARYLALACMLGGLTAFNFYVIDAIGVDQSWFGGMQSARLALWVMFLVASLFCVAKLDFVTRHYASLLTLVATLFVGFGCFIAYERHKNEPPEGLLWAVDMTLVICIAVLFGFSRLSALASTAIASVGAIATIMFLLTSSDIDKAQIARMSIQSTF